MLIFKTGLMIKKMQHLRYNDTNISNNNNNKGKEEKGISKLTYCF